MTTKVGLLGVLAVAAAGLFHPTTASAQERGYYGPDYGRGGYVQGYDNRGGDWRCNERFREQQWREAREREAYEREAWRDRQWREQQRCERRDFYRPPVVGFGIHFYGR